MQLERGRSPGASPSRQSRRRSHHERIPLSEVKAGAIVDGVVTWGNPRNGVFVDFGATRDGRLKVKNTHLYRRGRQVNSMTVASCDPETGAIVLLPDPTTMPDPAPPPPPPPPPPRAPPAPRGRARSGKRNSTSGTSASPPRRFSTRCRESRSFDSSVPRPRSSSTRSGRSRWRHSASRTHGTRNWDHPDGMQIEEVQEGSRVDGVVTGSSYFGVFVDFGCMKDGKLMLSKRFHREFKVGDQLRDLRVDSLDLQHCRISLVLMDLQATLRHLQRERVPLEELEEGMIVDGIICGVGPCGIFVNIGATKDGKLRVPRRVQLMMLAGEQVQGMRIEHIDLERQFLSLVFDNGAGQLEPSSASRAGSVVPGRRSPSRRTSPSPGPPEDTPVPLEDIRRGELADGIVVSKTPHGVMVDIGAMSLGTLNLPAETRQHFQVNDMVEGMVVEDVDLIGHQVFLSMDEPELALLDGRPYALATAEELPQAQSQRAPGAGRQWEAQENVQAKAKSKSRGI